MDFSSVIALPWPGLAGASPLNPTECLAETRAVRQWGWGAAGSGSHCSCLCKQGRVPEDDPHQTTPGNRPRSPPGLLSARPLVSPAPPGPSVPSQREAPCSGEENQGLLEDPTAHSLEHISASTSRPVTCQGHLLIGVSRRPVRDAPSSSSFDRWRNYPSEKLSDLCKVTQRVSSRDRI